MRNPRSRRAVLLVALAAGTAFLGCTPEERRPAGTYLTAVPDSVPATELDGFPTAATVGVPAGTTLQQWTGSLRASRARVPTVVVDGQECRLFEGYRFELHGDEQFQIDAGCVVLRKSSFVTDGDPASIVVQTAANRLLRVEDSTFDGGPFHARGVLAFYADVVVERSSFYRFGNAAVEMNDLSVSADLTVEDCYLYEARGWPTDQHVDGVQMAAGGSLTIRSNTIILEPFGGDDGDYGHVSNAPIGIGATLADIGDVLIEDNLLAGGGRLIYLQQKDFVFLGSVTVQDNVFDQRFFSGGAIWGPLHPEGLPETLAWLGNTWGDGTGVDLAQALAASP